MEALSHWTFASLPRLPTYVSVFVLNSDSLNFDSLLTMLALLGYEILFFFASFFLNNCGTHISYYHLAASFLNVESIQNIVATPVNMHLRTFLKPSVSNYIQIHQTLLERPTGSKYGLFQITLKKTAVFLWESAVSPWNNGVVMILEKMVNFTRSF